MQKSRKLIIIVIIILCIIAGVFIVLDEDGNRLLNLYDNITNSQRFTFSMEEVNSDIDYKISIAQRSSDINIDMKTNEEHTSTLILEGHAYFIIHEQEEYYEYDSDDIEGDVILSGLKEASKQEQYISGKEEINGKKYYYEEFDGITSFMILSDQDENSVVKTRFYFDGKDIKYIKNIIYNNGEQKEELLKAEVIYNADDSLFEIPKDYAEK